MLIKAHFIRVVIFSVCLVLIAAILPASPARDSAPIAYAQGGVQATVIPDNLVVRIRPGINASPLGEFSRDTVLTIEGREDLDGNGGVWVLATPASGGLRGWVHSDYLAFPAGFVMDSLPLISPTILDGSAPPSAGDDPGNDAPPAPSVEGSLPGNTTNAVNFRTGPGLNFSVIRTLEAGTPAAFTGRNGDSTWFRAIVGTQEGWLFYSLVNLNGNSSTLPVVSGETTAPPVDVPEGGLSGSTTSAVNFRTGPSTANSIIRTLSAGTPAAFIGRNSSGTWFKAVVGGQEGWLYYTLVNISGDRNALPVEGGTTGGGTDPINAPPPAVPSGPALAGFAYGAHVSSFAYPDLMRASGMTWVKKQIRYSPGDSAAGYAGMINDAHAKGFRILLGVVGHPNDVVGGDGYFQQYASFVAGLAGLGVDAIEVWNEPNLDREWATGHINPASYTRLLALSYNAIKGTNPNTVVISAAPSPTGAEGLFGSERVWNDDRYLAGMRDAGAGSYLDCVGAHYNEGIISPHQTSGDPRSDYYTRYFWGMVNTYYSIMGRPLCFTELGYLSPEGYGVLPSNFFWASNTSVQEHARWVTDAVRLSRSSGRVRLVIIWNMDFTGTFGNDPMGGYALVRPDGSCPACALLAGL